jgi:hypothetical protein
MTEAKPSFSHYFACTDRRRRCRPTPHRARSAGSAATTSRAKAATSPLDPTAPADNGTSRAIACKSMRSNQQTSAPRHDVPIASLVTALIA